ncbi:MAG: hypothetical protein RR382_10375 [Tannerellaceae bacterium]
MKMIKTLLDKIKHFIRYNVAMIKYRYAVKLADDAHKKSGERYFVMPNENDKLIVINRNTFRKFKMRGQIVHEAAVKDMIKESFYLTACKDETHPVHPSVKEAKRLMYLEYVGL